MTQEEQEKRIIWLTEQVGNLRDQNQALLDLSGRVMDLLEKAFINKT